MSSRGHSIPPVVVRKTRAPSQPRAEPAKTSRVRRKSPLNETGEQPQEQFPAILPPSRASSVVLPSIESSNQNSDIDNLTSGMKKIKLNLTTKAQREAKEQAKSATKAAAKAATKATSSKPTKPQPIQQPSNSNGAPSSSVQEPPQASIPAVTEQKSLSENFIAAPATPKQSLPAHRPAQIQEAMQVPLPASSPVVPAFVQPAPQQPSGGSDVFIPYQPEGPPPNTLTQQEPIRWLPPNTATPSPMKRADLPVFTATSAIPFSANPNVNTVPKPAEAFRKEDDSIWEVPETPEKR